MDLSYSKPVGSYGFVICVAPRSLLHGRRIKTKKQNKIVNKHPKKSSQAHTVHMWFLQNQKVIPLNFNDFGSFGLSRSLLPGQFIVRRHVAAYF